MIQASARRSGQLILPQKAMEAQSFGQRLRPVDGSWYMSQARNPDTEFLDKRIESAVRFDLDTVKDTTTCLPHMLPPPHVMQGYVDRVGLSRTRDTVLVYTHAGSFSAARVWWTFRAFGFQAHVLQGGLAGWQAVGGAVQSGQLPPPPPEKPREPVVLDPRMVATFEDIQAALKDERAIIIDARSAGRFSGTEKEPRPGLACGHIPGSVNLPFTEFFEPGSEFSRFKSVDEMRKLFESRGVNLEISTPIISSCGSGVTACVVSLAMQLCGRPAELCPVYDGSWAEWGARADTPKQTLG